MKRSQKIRRIPNWLLYLMARGCRFWDRLYTFNKALDSPHAQIGSALRIEIITYKAKEVLLQDGVRVRTGDRVVVLHLNNEFLKDLDPLAAVVAFKSSLRVLALSMDIDPRFLEVKACTTDTIFWNLHGLGFEDQPLSVVQEFLVRWGSRLLLVAFRRDGLAKADRHWGLKARRIWISTSGLKERF